MVRGNRGRFGLGQHLLWILNRQDLWSSQSTSFVCRKLRVGHDGEPFTAEDVVFSLQRAASGASQFKGFVQPIASAEVVGDHTVRIRTAAPSPDLPTQLPHVFIMSRRWAERHGVTATAPYDDPEITYAERHADGTGPFRLESFEPGVGSVMTRNPAWWGQGQNPHSIDRIEHAVLPTAIRASPTC